MDTRLKALYIVGAPRVGKTLLARTLCTIPGFVRSGEAVTIWDIGKSRRDDYRSREEATEKIVNRIRSEMESRTRALGGTCFIEESPHSALRIPFCRAVFPEAKFIHVVRDGRETIPEILGGWVLKPQLKHTIQTRLRSAEVRKWLKITKVLPRAKTWASNWVRHRLGLVKRAWGPTVPGQHEFAKSHAVHEIAAYQWVTTLEYALDGLEGLPQNSVLEVRRERILYDKDREFERIARFIGMDDKSALIHAANDLIAPDRRDPVLRPKHLTKQEWADILPMIEPMQRRLGYALEYPVCEDVSSPYRPDASSVDRASAGKPSLA
jgi:hypothetical protein